MKDWKKIIVITIIVCIIYFLMCMLMVILGNLMYSGYFSEENSNKEFMQARQNSQINFLELIEEEWDIAILLTNKNENDIIQKYKNKGIINHDYEYVELDPSIYQLCNIIFIKDGIEVNSIHYDRRYNEFKCKNEEYFYNTEAVFKVNKKGNKYIIEQE